jgi:hypothetical protein
MKFVPGMFGSEFSFRPAENGTRVLGLTTGQTRMGADKVGHNAGWYNKRGEKVGWGDISLRDMTRIVQLLAKGASDELFITMGEQDSFWNFVEKPIGPIGAMCKTTEQEKAPGFDYLVEHAMYVISKEGIHRILDRFQHEKKPGDSYTRAGHLVTFQSPEWLRGQLEGGKS